ncbi:ATP-binding cassette domain-containing protein [Pseudomonas sp. MIL19]|uniref:ATP-binding cassette domain-containing protein n=1 Tax=Pseudomonas sp. MIL19 TaxID=2976979 RepID=UPI0023640FEE|nr:ATP-binding cassette domain-containing protein [Pseudomonas sp. MIL19]MDD2161165.1 ATP-binding cassette domain-containing protein [Pseudomonas sp. MIL19]
MDGQNGAQEQPGIALALVKQLLASLQVPCDGAALQQACMQVGHGAVALKPADWLRQVLVQAGLKNLAPVQLAWRRLDLRRLPALVCTDDGWFLAVREAPDALTLINAAGERREVHEAELQDALVVWLRAPTSRNADAGRAFSGNLATRLVWRELFRERGWLWKVMVATVLVNLLAVGTSIFAMQVYDRVVPTLAYATLTTLVTGMAMIILLDWLLKTTRARILDSLSCAVDKRVSQQVFEHLLHVRLDQQPRSLGTLAAQVGGLDTVRQFFSSGVVFALVDLPFALLFLAFIAIIGGAVGWVYALLLPVALLLGYVTQWRLRALLKQQMLRSNERQGLLVDTIRGAESIRANNAGWRFAQEWQSVTASIDGYSIQQRAISSFSSVSTSSLSTLAYVAAVVVGVWQIEAGLLTMGGLIACSILGGRVIAPIAQSVQYLAQWQHVRQALQMVHQVLSLERDRRSDQHLLLPDELPSEIGLDRVRFAYPESPVCQVNIEGLRFTSGERVLLVGPVGCGKSTLLKVLAGLYRPSEGRVRLGDADLWEIDPQLVASQVGYLPQTVQLFKGSLRSNLALTGASSDSRLLQITRELGIDAIAASSPQGMDLSISEGGEGLSGGQRQLVALARVLINQPRIWLLDEPTAALDGESEQRAWAALQEAVRPEDILIVATHRPMAATRLATRVIVMQQGQVTKDDTPDKVLAQMLARPVASSRMGKGGTLDVV